MLPDPGGVIAAIASGNSYFVGAQAVVYTPPSANVPAQPFLTIPIEAKSSAVSVTLDRHATTRRVGSLSVTGSAAQSVASVIPTTPQAALAPFGNEMVLYATVGSSQATMTRVPLGVFAIDTATLNDTTTDLTCNLHLSDRSWVVSTRKLKTTYNVPSAGGNMGAELQQLIANAYPGLQYNIQATASVMPQQAFNEGQDPWEGALNIAASLGYELFSDVNGVMVAFPTPLPSTQSPVWAFVETTPNPNATIPQSNAKQVTFTQTRAGISNDFVWSGTGSTQTTAPVRAVAIDNTPGSPTFVGSAFGDVPTYTTASLVTTQAQAQAAANNALNISISSAQQVAIVCTPNPLLDVDDVVTVSRGRMNMQNTPVVIDTITHVGSPFDVMQIVGRVVG